VQTLKRHVGESVVVLLAVACGPRPEPASGRFDAAAEFAKVTAVHAQCVAARERMEQAQMSGVPAAGGDAALREAEAAYDVAYTRDQLVVATFLNQALNVAPERPETRAALALYTDAAVTNARHLLDRGGDPQQALEALMAAERAFRALDLPVPAGLATTLAAVRRPPPPTVAPTTVAPAPRRSRHRR
jgi:hypothetical protein